MHHISMLEELATYELDAFTELLPNIVVNNLHDLNVLMRIKSTSI